MAKIGINFGTARPSFYWWNWTKSSGTPGASISSAGVLDTDTFRILGAVGGNRAYIRTSGGPYYLLWTRLKLGNVGSGTSQTTRDRITAGGTEGAIAIILWRTNGSGATTTPADLDINQLPLYEYPEDIQNYLGLDDSELNTVTEIKDYKEFTFKAKSSTILWARANVLSRSNTYGAIGNYKGENRIDRDFYIFGKFTGNLYERKHRVISLSGTEILYLVGGSTTIKANSTHGLEIFRWVKDNSELPDELKKSPFNNLRSYSTLNDFTATAREAAYTIKRQIIAGTINAQGTLPPTSTTQPTTTPDPSPPVVNPPPDDEEEEEEDTGGIGSTVISRAISTLVDGIVKAYNDIVSKIKASITNTINLDVTAISNAIKNFADRVKTFADGVVKSIKDSIKDLADKLPTAISSALKTVLDGIKTAVSNIGTAVKNGLTGINTTVGKIVKDIGAVITTAFSNISTAITGAIDKIKTTIKTAIDGTTTAVKSVATQIATSLSTVITDIKTVFTSTLTTIKSNLQGVITILKDQVSEITTKIGDAIERQFEYVKIAGQDAWNFIVEQFGEFNKEFIKNIGNPIERLSNEERVILEPEYSSLL